MPEAARVGDIIGHSKSMWGMLVGTVLGAAIAIGGAVVSGVLMGVGIAASCIGVGVLAIGASLAVGYGTGLLAEWVRDKCVETGSKSLRTYLNRTLFQTMVPILQRPGKTNWYWPINTTILK